MGTVNNTREAGGDWKVGHLAPGAQSGRIWQFRLPNVNPGLPGYLPQGEWEGDREGEGGDEDEARGATAQDDTSKAGVSSETPNPAAWVYGVLCAQVPRR